jgi:molybdopterin molybdotransferase
MKGFARKSHPQALSDLVNARIAPLPGERVPVEHCHRRIVAEDVPLTHPGSLSSFFEESLLPACPPLETPADLGRGHRLTPMDLAMLVFLGIGEVTVYRQPRVALFMTGNELLPCGSKPEGHRIVDSNSVMLAGLLARDGGMPLPATILADSPDVLRGALRDCVADLILVSGGSSVGLEDHAADVLASDGALCIHGINMRPGVPIGFGFHAGRPVFLLPGNPVSCLCTYDLFAGGVVRRLAGGLWALPYPTTTLPFRGRVESPAGRLDYVRVRIVRGAAELLGSGKGSGAAVLTSTTLADGFVLVPPERERIQDGEPVTVYLYGSTIAAMQKQG